MAYMTNEDAQVQGQTLAAQNLLAKGTPIEQVKQLFPLAQLDNGPTPNPDQFDVNSSNSTATAGGFQPSVDGTGAVPSYPKQPDPQSQPTQPENTAAKPAASLYSQLVGSNPTPQPKAPISSTPTPPKPDLTTPAGPPLPTVAEKTASLMPKEHKGLGFFFDALAGIGDVLANVSNAAYGTNLKTDRMSTVMQMQSDLKDKLRKQVTEKVAKDPNTQEARQIQDAIIQSQGLKPDSPEAANIRKMSLFDITADPYKTIMAANSAKALQAQQEKFTSGENAKKMASEERIAGVKNANEYQEKHGGEQGAVQALQALIANPNAKEKDALKASVAASLQKDRNIDEKTAKRLADDPANYDVLLQQLKPKVNPPLSIAPKGGAGWGIRKL